MLDFPHLQRHPGKRLPVSVESKGPGGGYPCAAARPRKSLSLAFTWRRGDRLDRPEVRLAYRASDERCGYPYQDIDNEDGSRHGQDAGVEELRRRVPQRAPVIPDADQGHDDVEDGIEVARGRGHGDEHSGDG